MSGSREIMLLKPYLTNKNASISCDLQKPQLLSTLDKGLVVEEREKQLLFACYKLQRWFLQPTSALSELEVSTTGELLTSLELCPNLEQDLMHETKIYKVLKKVGDSYSIPREQGDTLRRCYAMLFDIQERQKRLDSRTLSITDQESMAHSEVVLGSCEPK